MRLLCIAAMLLLPLIAAGTVVAAPTQEVPQSQESHAWTLLDNSDQPILRWGSHGLGFRGAGLASNAGSAVDFMFTPSWHARALIDQRSWQGVGSTSSCLAANPAVRQAGCHGPGMAPGLIYSEIGAVFDGEGFSLDLNVSSSRPAPRSPLLPRVLPRDSNLAATVNGLPFDILKSGTSLRAHGRVSLGGNNGLDIGASMGRIRLLPNNLLGIHMLGQKSLSLGLDSGPVSGHIVGRLIQPEAGVEPGLLGPEHRWTSIDLGVTWRLPWQGSLSFGAQNVWTSGEAPKPKAGKSSIEQSSIPYVQYHQDF